MSAPRSSDSNPHFVRLKDWSEAEPYVGFRPRIPTDTGSHELSSLTVFVRDHRMREVDMAERALEAHYGTFVLSQSRPGAAQARESVVKRSYGGTQGPVRVAGLEGRSYDLGPPALEDDPDGRAPAVLVWAETDRFFLIASDQLEATDLLPIAESLYHLEAGR